MGSSGRPPSLRPLLVTGSHRSGTTWIGEVLSKSRSHTYVFEPWNLAIDHNWARVAPGAWFPYIVDGSPPNSALVHSLDAVMRLRYPLRHAAYSLGANRGQTRAASLGWAVRGHFRRRSVPLVKDPFLLLSSQFFAQRYEANVLIVVRHPAAFAVSLQDKNWSFDFNHLLRQGQLVEGPLAPLAEEIERAASNPELDLLDGAALLWRCLYSFVREQLIPRPDITLLRYEDLLRDPVGEFSRLQERYGFEPSHAYVRTIRRTEQQVAQNNPYLTRWKNRLPDTDKNRIRDALGGAESWLYVDSDWD